MANSIVEVDGTQTTANMLNIHFEINQVNKQNHNTETSVEYAAYPMTW